MMKQDRGMRPPVEPRGNNRNYKWQVWSIKPW